MVDFAEAGAAARGVPGYGALVEGESAARDIEAAPQPVPRAIDDEPVRVGAGRSAGYADDDLDVPDFLK